MDFVGGRGGWLCAALEVPKAPKEKVGRLFTGEWNHQ